MTVCPGVWHNLVIPVLFGAILIWRSDMKYICTVCNWIYDPAVGDPDSGIAPGTSFDDIPDTWECPECGVGKDDFEPLNS